MAPYYRQLFTGNPMALIPLSLDDLEGFKSRSRKLKATELVWKTKPVCLFIHLSKAVRVPAYNRRVEIQLIYKIIVKNFKL
jgi:hypothetical protein